MSHHHPIGKDRLARLRTACDARSGGEKRAADRLFESMRAQFRDLKPAVQEQLLDALERAVAAFAEHKLIHATPSAATVDAVVASLTPLSDLTQPLSRTDSSSIT